MGIFDKLGGTLGSQKGIDVEEYMNMEEMENVDAMNEPADFYIKPVALTQESDVELIEAELQKRNIILLNVSEISKRQNTLKSIIDTLKTYVEKIDGDIAKLDDEKILITPKKVKIIKSRKQQPKR
ncbi:MAG: cell division protein SepF [Candidatus Marsarchaeota archaeon]|jgi:SepF-like predicted cell division protein (DUF552 family)|nr:cell division protein SepF [Candidatus Marsarchaeota archaeon]